MWVDTAFGRHAFSGWTGNETALRSGHSQLGGLGSSPLGGADASGGCGCVGCSMQNLLQEKLDLYASGGLLPVPKSNIDLPQMLGDDIGDDIGSSATLSLGATLNSSIQSEGDADFIRVSMVAGETYTFHLDGITLADAYLELRDSSGNLIEFDDDGGILYDSFLMHQATATGDYFIVARAFEPDGFPSTTGSYTLSFNQIPDGNTSPTAFTPNGKPFYSWDEAAIQITRTGSSWSNAFNSPAVITYSFRSTAPTTMPSDTTGFSRFSEAQIIATELALAAWASVANITFVRDGSGTSGEGAYSNNASIVFANYSAGASGAAAFAYLPSTGNTSASSVQGDVWVNNSLAYNANPVILGYGQQVLLHEIGHALGLSHPGDYNAGPGVVITYAAHADYYQDTRLFSAMSYFSSSTTGGVLPGFASMPLMHDIAAIQRLYGAATNTRTGNTTYGFNSNTGITEFTLTNSSSLALFTIYDSGGTDTLDLSGYTQASTIDLREESYSSANGYQWNISIARGSVVENAVGGSGNDIITGNAVGNSINGGDGADTLTGGLGNDNIDGGEGDDTIQYFSGDGVDSVNGGNGTDTLNITGSEGGQTLVMVWNGSAFTSYTGGTLTSVEVVNANLAGGTDTLRFTGSSAGVSVNLGTGSATGFGSLLGVENVYGANFNDTLTGDGNANVLFGEGGDDVLSGAAGADNLQGGDGNDTINGGDDADLIYGGLGVDTLSAGDGNDTIRYIFGDGVDVSTDGGAGTDTLQIYGTAFSQTLDVVWNGTSFTSYRGGTVTSVEQMIADLDNGTDSLRYTGSTVGVTVNLTLGTATGFISIASIENVYGTDFADTITGNGENNIVFSEGGDDIITTGEGIDAITAGGGNDTIDAGGGNDTVRYFFGDGVDSVNGGDGTDKLVVIGSASGETLTMVWNGVSFTSFTGGSLVSIERAAVDLGLGNDTLSYAGSSVGVTVNLAAGQATGFNDLANAENVTGGDFNDTLSGTSGANVLDGGGGDDVLSGFAGADTIIGGAGNDTMNGGNGNDTFVFTTGSGADTIIGFDADAAGGQDLLDIVGYGVTSATFSSRVTITDQGSHTLVTIDGVSTILLNNVTGDGGNVITQADFLLA